MPKQKPNVWIASEKPLFKIKLIDLRNAKKYFKKEHDLFIEEPYEVELGKNYEIAKGNIVFEPSLAQFIKLYEIVFDKLASITKEIKNIEPELMRFLDIESYSLFNTNPLEGLGLEYAWFSESKKQVQQIFSKAIYQPMDLLEDYKL